MGTSAEQSGEHHLVSLAGPSKNPELVKEARRLIGIHPALSAHSKSLSINFEHGQLSLAGCLASFYLKQLLQTALKDVSGVKQIVNDATVATRDPARVRET